MQGEKYVRRFIFSMGVSMILALTGCSGGGGGGGAAPGGSVSPAAQATADATLAAALSAQNVVDIHDDTSSSYNSDCLSCHGDKSSGTASDGRPDAHAAMMPWTPGSDTNTKCVWCHDKVNLEYRNPSNSTYADTYSNYLDPSLPSSSNQFDTVRLDTNHYDNGALRHQHDAILCLQCHALGTAQEFYAK